jgi:hypothetical protein
MNQPNLPKQDSETIHTPAIFDCPPKSQETRANAGFPQSTGARRAVHNCGPLNEKPSVRTGASAEGGQ